VYQIDGSVRANFFAIASYRLHAHVTSVSPTSAPQALSRYDDQGSRRDSGHEIGVRGQVRGVVAAAIPASALAAGARTAGRDQGKVR
jgi:hypothetical protein